MYSETWSGSAEWDTRRGSQASMSPWFWHKARLNRAVRSFSTIPFPDHLPEVGAKRAFWDEGLLLGESTLGPKSVEDHWSFELCRLARRADELAPTCLGKEAPPASPASVHSMNGAIRMYSETWSGSAEWDTRRGSQASMSPWFWHKARVNRAVRLLFDWGAAPRAFQTHGCRPALEGAGGEGLRADAASPGTGWRR